VSSRTIDLGGPSDLVATLRPLAHGGPNMRFASGEVWVATRTPDGTATLRLTQTSATTIVADAWGRGAAHALDRAPALVGADDDPGAFVPTHPLLRDLHRRFAGARLPRATSIVEQLIPIVLEQKVQSAEAKASYRQLVWRHGEPAPGAPRLRVPPDPAVVARLPYWEFHRCGVEKRRADTTRRVALAARRLEAEPSRMTAIPGVGPWTAGELGMRALSDSDAVPVGDYHLPHTVSYALAGEPRGDDRRMLELLEPYRPHRARVLRLLVAAGIRAPRYGPRLPRSLLNPLERGRPARV
jgi:3-methyladenine DNA glycosylase/8-oxoguanine DNA glycosylase